MKRSIRNASIAIILGLAAAGTLVACDDGKSGTAKDQAVVAGQLARYQKNQPVPTFDRSQYRQTLIDVETAEVHGTATTTFFFQQGVADPIMTCPSIGYPLASTAQLTNPEQAQSKYQTPYTLPQEETNGVYTGDSSGTFVVCVQSNGTKQIDYWEGFVYTTGGPAEWDGTQVVTTGDSTVMTK